VRKGIRYVGLDVHKETITVAVAEGEGLVVEMGKIPNRPEAVRRLIKRLGRVEKLRVCYEAGPCGYVLYWQLAGLNVECEVVAPSRIPREPGDRVKTDRRDAKKLAVMYRAGMLTAVWVPDAAHEALRDLVRAREAAKKDELRARHRLGKFLLRSGRRAPDGVKAWGKAHSRWLEGVGFEHPEQEVVFLDYRHEVDHAVERVLRLERALEEAVERVPALKKRQAGVSEEIKEISWKAQHRLYGRYRHLISKGKLPQKAITAVGRELVGFFWDIGVRVENQMRRQKQGHAAA
jgi:transposase